MDARYVLTIVAMACVTYFTRVAGFVLLGNREVGPRMRAVFDAAPGCVLLTLITPLFVTKNLGELLALGLTVLAATRLPMLPTLIVSIGSAGLLRMVFH